VILILQGDGLINSIYVPPAIASLVKLPNQVIVLIDVVVFMGGRDKHNGST